MNLKKFYVVIRPISIFLALFLAFLPLSYAAGWSVKSEVDSMTDERTHEAQTVNAGGHSLHVYRLSNGSIGVTFRLSEQGSDVLGDTPPPMRVDKNKPFDFDLIKSLVRMNREGLRDAPIKVAYHAEPKWVSAIVYPGKDIPDRGPIYDLMTGKNVVVRYFLFTGGYKETSFSLVGAKEAITKAISSSVIP